MDEKLAEQVSVPFLQGMVARMEMSFFKYGHVKEAYPHKFDAIASLFIRLIRYLGPDLFREKVEAALAQMPAVEAAPHHRATGNTEYLMDAANFAMIEFMYPKLNGAFFEPTDSDQSAGRMATHGVVDQRANTESRELARAGKSFYTREGD